jgi:hypothetical protein
MYEELEKILKVLVNSIEEFNNISENVNGRDAIILPPYENKTDDMYLIRRYIISCDEYIHTTQKSDYKSMVSETMKRKFIDVTDKTKEIIKISSDYINDFIYRAESLEVKSFIANKENLQKFNEVLNTSHPDSMVATYIANNIMNEEDSVEDRLLTLFIMNSNIKLKALNKKILCNISKQVAKSNSKEIVTNYKKVKYDLYTDFKFQNLCESVYLNSKNSNIVSDILEFLKINISMKSNQNTDIRDELFLHECIDSYKNTYNKNLYICIGDHKSYIGKKVTNDLERDFVYSIKNITNAEIINAESGINKKYVEKTTTISKDIEENYLSPISLVHNSFTIHNWLDIYEANLDELNGDVLCLVFRKNKQGDDIVQVCGLFSLYKNLQLFQPELNHADTIVVNNVNKTSLDNLSSMIPSLYNNKKDMSDLGIFESVKIGHIRHRMLEMLKLYVRNQNKIENTDYLIKVLFDSIYNEIWHKTPKTSNFSDEFFITFYSSVSRMVFKVRKDIMDRYSIMKDYESVKSVMIDVLEKLEKNISKTDSNIYNIYKITS